MALSPTATPELPSALLHPVVATPQKSRHRWQVRYRISGLPASVSGEGAHINNAGQIISDTTFLRGGRWSAITIAGTDDTYKSLDIKGLNSEGAVVSNITGEYSGAYIIQYSKAVIWRDGRTAALPAVKGAEFSATGINDRDEVSGYSFENSNDALADTDEAFLYRKGTMIDLGRGEALCLNNRSQLVVQWRSPDSYNFNRVENGQAIGEQVSDTYVWDGGRRQPIITPPDYGNISSEFVGISDRGLVVGTVDTNHSSRFSLGPISRAFVWRAGKMQVLGAFGGEDSAALGLNNGGEVVGEADTPSRMKDGEAVTHAFLWRNGQMQDLNDLIPARSGWTLAAADAINDRGQIVGSGSRGAFLLTPLAGRPRK